MLYSSSLGGKHAKRLRGKPLFCEVGGVTYGQVCSQLSNRSPPTGARAALRALVWSTLAPIGGFSEGLAELRGLWRENTRFPAGKSYHAGPSGEYHGLARSTACHITHMLAYLPSFQSNLLDSPECYAVF